MPCEPGSRKQATCIPIKFEAYGCRPTGLLQAKISLGTRLIQSRTRHATGSRLEALHAGTTPKKIPMTLEQTRAAMIEAGE